MALISHGQGQGHGHGQGHVHGHSHGQGQGHGQGHGYGHGHGQGRSYGHGQGQCHGQGDVLRSAEDIKKVIEMDLYNTTQEIERLNSIIKMDEGSAKAELLATNNLLEEKEAYWNKRVKNLMDANSSQQSLLGESTKRIREIGAAKANVELELMQVRSDRLFWVGVACVSLVVNLGFVGNVLEWWS